MPWSVDEGKPWVADRVCARCPSSLLDVGAGAGLWSMTLRHRLPGCVFIALEVFEPYVDQFGLHERYDEIVVGDARTTPFPAVDVVILGDVLEHMTHEDALSVWDKARRAARMAVFASVPLGEFPQGPEYGNNYERHLTTWTHPELRRLPGVVESAPGRIVGVYEARPWNVDGDPVTRGGAVILGTNRRWV
jgi:hypothetical protein